MPQLAPLAELPDAIAVVAVGFERSALKHSRVFINKVARVTCADAEVCERV
jgi:hypothetical protein